jgi:glycosyltransferase involved in cell wall biosynthesis
MENQVSLAFIVKNEEGTLRSCLQSVAPIAREIIVVDTGSTDRTKEIAASFGAKVFDFPWCNDFAAARNECIRHATGEWGAD